MQKDRPCVVIQNDVANWRSQTIVVALITGYKKENKSYPFKVFISAKETGLPEDSLVACNQILTVDRSRLTQKLGVIPEKRMQTIDMALIQHLDLDYT
jgi:mRNA interferase MazF